MSDYILVKSNRNDHKVVLWERDERHPHAPDEEFGEVWVDGSKPKPVEVYPTDLVRLKIADGELVEVKPEKKAPATVAPAEKTK